MGEPATKAEPFSPETGKVAIRDPDGTVWKIPASQLTAAQEEGARPATEAEWHANHLGAAGQVGSATIGAARGVSLGYSDKLYVEGARALGGDDSAETMRHTLNLAREMHPDATTGGEYGGAAIPMFFGGGGAASAAVRGQGLLARAASRAVAAAPRAFAEGAVIGAGQQSSEDTLGDHKVAAENYLSAGFKGGAIGVILGTALHAGGGAVSDKVSQRFGGGLGREATEDAERKAFTIHAAHDAPLPEQGPYRTFGARDEMPIGNADAPIGSRPSKVTFDTDAGLRETAGATERPFTIDPTKRYPVGLDARAPEGEFASVEGAGSKPIGKIATVGDGSALEAEGAGEPFFTTTQPRTDIPGASHETLLDRAQYGGRKGASAERRLAEFPHENVVRSHLEEPVDIFSGVRNDPAVAQAPFEARFGLPDRGLGGLSEEVGERQVIGRGLRKDAPRRVGFDPGDAGAVPSRPAFGIEAPPAMAPAAAAPEALAAESAIAAERQPLSTMGRLQQEIDRRQFAATGARVPDIRKLGATAGAQDEARRRIGATLAKEVPTGPFTTLQDYAEKIATRTSEVGKSIRPMIGELDAAVARPDVARIASRFDEVRQKIGAGLFGDEELAAAEKAMGALADKAGTKPSFTKLYDLRRDLDDKLSKHWARIPGMPTPPGERAVRELRDIIQDELMQGAERASSELGKPIAQRLSLANSLYKDLKAAKDISTKEAARAAGSPMYSASDMMSVVAAVASGSPLGAAIPVANVIRKQFGNQIAAHVLRKASQLEAIQAASNSIDAALSKGTRAVIENTSTSARPMKLLTEAQVRAVRDASLDQTAVSARVAQALGDTAQVAPKTAAEFALTAARIASYLSQVLPKDRPPTSPMFTGEKPRKFSDSELVKASAVIETAQDPTIILDRMQHGQLTREHVKALKASHPEAYAKIQNYLTEHAAEIRPTMTIQQQVALSVLFQKPIAAVMERANITALQASFVGGNQGPPKGMAPTVAKMAAGPVHGGGTRATTFDIAEKGGRK